MPVHLCRVWRVTSFCSFGNKSRGHPVKPMSKKFRRGLYKVHTRNLLPENVVTVMRLDCYKKEWHINEQINKLWSMDSLVRGLMFPGAPENLQEKEQGCKQNCVSWWVTSRWQWLPLREIMMGLLWPDPLGLLKVFPPSLLPPITLSKKKPLQCRVNLFSFYSIIHMLCKLRKQDPCSEGIKSNSL